ncbi:putative WRKY transcription factor 4-like [Dorcoceras hygrometricum]|uniref:Putative WRKY transcription factor 4-like n=1 Tax=Dorcoceras hygrometricum TaxID=472368 RepID=A0A2Z7DF29_9LAMI|nr:putative WRKY transcription factor 4-like [Dorcoceras hygrometricum]
MLTQKLTLAEERTHRLLLKSFELQQLRASTLALKLGSKWAANERAKLRESSATQIFKNRGWNHRKNGDESSSDQKAIARNTPKRHRSNLSKRRRSDTPADNSSRKHNDQKLVTALSPKQSICWSREITQNVDASTNPNDVISQH